MNEAVRTDVALLVATTPTIVFSDPKKAEELFVHIEREIAEFKPDLTTDKGRKAVAALAFKVTKTKTAIDDAGAVLNEEANKQINAVNAERRRFKTRLDALRDKARQPLTDWETAEEDRKQLVANVIAGLKTVRVSPSDSSEAIEAAIAKTKAVTFDEVVFQDRLDEATDLHQRVLHYLGDELAREKQAEIDRAELQRLREEQAARDKREAETAAAARAEQERQFQERAQEQAKARVAEEEQRRVDEAAENARKTAESEADAARQQTEREHQQALDKAEAEKQAIIDEAARVERQRAADAQRAADEQAARDANKAHRKKVIAKAAKAISEITGLDDEKAVNLVVSIIAGSVPAISLKF